jgi:phage gp29-like protein
MSLIEFFQNALGAARGVVDTIVSEVALWRQFSRIGGNLTPGEVSNIIYDADMGRPAKLVDLVHECRQKDGHFQAVLGTREIALAGLPWGIDPPPEATTEEKKQALLTQRAIEQCDDFVVLLAHLVGEGTLFPTGAWAENIWGFERFGELAGMEVPVAFNRISSRRFGFRRSDSRLVFVEFGQEPENSGVDLLEEYPAGNFIHYLPRVNGDVRVREGLARVLLWLALFRNWGVRDWLLLAEMGWKPWRIASYTKSSDGKDREFARGALRALSSTGAAVKPDSIDLDVFWPKMSGAGLQSVHREMSEFFGQEMSKATVGQTLTTEAGSRGARSLGEVQNNIRLDVRDFDVTGVEASVNRDIVAHIYGFNWPTARRGTFRFKTEADLERIDVAEIVSKLADKLDIPEDWVREKIGIRKPSDDEPCCGSREEGEAAKKAA